jgi:predicted ester cyclase
MNPEHFCAVQKAVARFNDTAGREGYFDLYSPACVVHGLPPGLPPTLTGLRAFYHRIWQAFPDIAITLEDVFGDNESLAVRFEARGLHEEDFFGLPASGKLTTFVVLCFLRFRNGLVVERWAQMAVVE